jgi:hypothetical protein
VTREEAETAVRILDAAISEIESVTAPVASSQITAEG